MAAMQELRDGGSVAMLSAVNDLYELLTFNEVMQDISIKDTEILDNMKNAKEALESDKLTLESQRSELQSKKADLDAQNSQMRAKQNELNSSVAAAQMSAAEAQQAQKDAQAAIESDEMNYEAVKKQIQKMIAAAAASKPTLSFTGFICPLKSYSRISSEYSRHCIASRCTGYCRKSICPFFSISALRLPASGVPVMMPCAPCATISRARCPAFPASCGPLRKTTPFSRLMKASGCTQSAKCGGTGNSHGPPSWICCS